MEIIRRKMHKTIGIMLLTIMLISVAIPVFAATGKITLDKTSMDVTYEAGKVITIKVKENTTGEDVFWSSSNKSVVATNEIQGYTGSFFSKPRADLKLKGTGTTTITAKTKDGTVKASCTLNVKPKATDKNNNNNNNNNNGGSNGGGNTSGSGESLIGIGGTIIGGIFEVATSETTISAVTGFFTMIKDFLAGIIESILSSIRDVEMPSFEMPSFEIPSTEQPKDESKKEVKTTGITVSPNTTTIDAGKSVNLTATFSPSNATDKEIIWESTNTDIATVTQAGKVTAKENASGTVDIKAVLKSDNAVVGKCKVTVNAAEQGAGSGGGTTQTSHSINDSAMNFLAGVLFAEAGDSSAGQIAVGYTIKNRMGNTLTTQKLMSVLTAKSQFSTVVKKGNEANSHAYAQWVKYNQPLMEITYGGNTYITKKYTSTSLQSAKAVMNGTANNPIGERDGFNESGYYAKNTSGKSNPIKIGNNTFFYWD